MKRICLLLAALLCACAGENSGASPAPSTVAASPGQAMAATVAPALERAFPALTFTQPVDLQTPADGSGRLYIVEQAGVVKGFAPTEQAATVFLDIRDRVADGGEMGLLGLAFHPQFKTNRHFYVNYTADSPRRTIIARFTLKADGTADPASEQQVLTFDQPYSNHNGGQLAFGPDGHLYVGTGDGGSAGDPRGNGQSKTTVLGKLLRLDIDHPSEGRAYGTPADNPLVGQGGGVRPEIFAWGIRNLWRFAFDRESGRIWGADVGQNQLEEIDILEKGKNYGWNIMEGTTCYLGPNCNQAGLTLPVAEYPRSEGQSVTGGYVYRGKRAPSLVGSYLYADFVSGKLWALAAGGQPRLLLNTELNVSSFGQDADRELYLLDHGGGGLWRFN